MSVIHDEPPEQAVSLGSDHLYTKGVDQDGVWIAIHEWHKTSDGRWCVGYVPFDVPESKYFVPRSEHWTVESYEPLTLSPSLLCTACNSHGFIREGKWVGC